MHRIFDQVTTPIKGHMEFLMEDIDFAYIKFYGSILVSCIDMSMNKNICKDGSYNHV